MTEIWTLFGERLLPDATQLESCWCWENVNSQFNLEKWWQAASTISSVCPPLLNMDFERATIRYLQLWETSQSIQPVHKKRCCLGDRTLQPPRKLPQRNTAASAWQTSTRNAKDFTTVGFHQELAEFHRIITSVPNLILSHYHPLSHYLPVISTSQPESACDIGPPNSSLGPSVQKRPVTFKWGATCSETTKWYQVAIAIHQGHEFYEFFKNVFKDILFSCLQLLQVEASGHFQRNLKMLLLGAASAWDSVHPGLPNCNKPSFPITAHL